ncbi:MAG: prepilin-type N-terminal cleavage/methylation domain-containing protein [Planctomycetes bacterium]|nr:prepilin-type N-terminal cleavage/methylation domain-containing protein [Planctomycetota bacterium]
MRKGFTLIELMAVVVILAILAGVALPKFFNYAAQSKVAATKGTLGGVRAGIANFYADKAINSATSRYPTLAELSGTSVMLEILPDNPYRVLPATWWSRPPGRTPR